MKKFDVVIIGAGTAGLSARKEVAKVTDNYAIIDNGPLGTTCARVGCMPSKVLIQAANDYYNTKSLETIGVSGNKHIKLDHKKLMNYVRSLRDRFVRSVNSSIDEFKDKIIAKRAKFVDAHHLDLGDEIIYAKRIIIATGSRPIIPAPWLEYKDYLINTNEFFESESFPKSVGVLGLGVIGIELGQALSRIGTDVIGIGLGKEIGGLTDPKLQDYVIDKMSKEFPIYTNGANIKGIKDNKLILETQGKEFLVDKALVSLGRRSNLDLLDLDNAGVTLNERGMPQFDKTTFSLLEADHIFIAGDVNGHRPILHEASDQGKIAGINAVSKKQSYKEKTGLGITFSDPNIATVGTRFKDLKEDSFETGGASFEGQGRSIVKRKEMGLLSVYAEKESQKIVGAEIFGPDAEHLAHLLAWVIDLELDVKRVLELPFYHPVIEEGLRTALRDLYFKLNNSRSLELKMIN
ncbi:MAG: dihydrolipoyl dehydrogenase [Bacteriovoracaceae bacterium]|jgi:dihydrolipoamide dehydrogenase|nr:dihydrolipoyl dehydrogenase [Bacteriovoracaceae bacterium]